MKKHTLFTAAFVLPFTFCSLSSCKRNQTTAPQPRAGVDISTSAESGIPLPDEILENHGNLILVGTASETVYVHPSRLLDWLNDRQTRNFRQGQVTQCRIAGELVAVSAPHVVDTPGWFHKVPSSDALGPWTSSVDGREISFARLSDPKKLGFVTEAVEAAEPENNAPATIHAAQFSVSEKGIAVYEAEGKLEIVSGKVHLDPFAKFFNSDTSIGNRLQKRAPNAAMLAMVIDETYRHQVQGMSGALVWQKGRPVGVFIACVLLSDMPPLAISEPLLEPGRMTLAKMK